MILKDNKPKINGLVLTGGKSVRMGKPKGQMKWHGKEQHYFAADLLNVFCEEVFISCRKDQLNEISHDYVPLTDTFLNMGPMGGILSALRSARDKAWLVVACDLPLLNQKTLQFLMENRDVNKTATTFESPFDGKPEPLITIWEPQSYTVLLNSLAQDITCPRKVLLNSDIKIMKPLDSQSLMNVNTPEDEEIANLILNKR